MPESPRPSSRPVAARLLDSYLRRAAAGAKWTGLEELQPRLLFSGADADDQITEATLLTLNPSQTVNGTIDVGTDVDVYAIDVVANSRLTFDLDAAVGSTLNSIIRVFNAAGTQLFSNDNAAAPGETLGLDPFLACNFTKAGRYYVAVSAKGNAAYNAVTGAGDKMGATTGGYTLAVANVTPADNAGNTPAAARNIGALAGTSNHSDFVGAIDTADFHKFTVAGLSKIDASLTGLSADANLELIHDKNNNGKIDAGEIVASSKRTSSNDESIAYQGAAGTYFVRVIRAAGDTTYNLAVTAAATPEVTVLGNNASINDGGKAAASNHSLFGNVQIGGDPIARTFTVRNDGTANLTLSNLTVPAGYTIVEGLSATLAPGASDTFTVRLDTAVLGTKAGSIAFTTNDWNETAFDFGVRGIVTPVDHAGNTPAAPRNLGAFSGASDYDDFVGAVDTVDFYKFTLGGVSKASLGLTGLTNNANLELIHDKNNNGKIDSGELLASSNKTGVAAESIVRQLTTGTYLVRVVRVTGDTNYNLALSAELTPDITVRGNNANVADGDASPSATDHTHFGTSYHDALGTSRTFTVRNDGGTDLVIDSLSIPAGYTLIEGLDSTIAAGGSDTFTIRLDTGVIGVKAGQIVIECNDWNEGPFNYSITGTVAAIPADIVVLYDQTQLTDGDLTPSAGDGTDFGTVNLGDGGVERTFTVRNDGEVTLKLGVLKLPAGWTLVEGLSANILGGQSDTFTIRLTGVNIGTPKGQFSFTTNDPTVATFNVAVSGVVAAAQDGGGDWFDSNLLTANIRAMARVKFADDSLSRADMLQVFQAAPGADNVIDAYELADLRTIVTSHSTLNMADYVRFLASNVVNAATANAKYLGLTLGNLKAGSTAVHLTKLVNKWFLGLDRPVAKNPAGNVTYAYREFAGQLFVGGAGLSDVRQGYVGNCYYIAALGSVAQDSPETIGDMFIDNGDGTYTVRFFNNGAAQYVTVDRYLPTTAGGAAIFAGQGTMYNNAAAELWVALAEKAYAQVNESGWIGQSGTNAYQGLAGGLPHLATKHISNFSTAYTGIHATASTVIQWLSDGILVTAGTKSSTSGGIVGGHAYVITGYDEDTGTFDLFNPWGYQHADNLTWAQIQANFNNFFTAAA